MRLFDAARTRLRLMFARRSAESRMEEEFRFHVDMETERLVREQGLEPREARRRAVIAFGIAEQHKDALRDGRGLAWFGGLALDFRLGARMLRKYPGLTAVGGLAMAFAIFAGVVTFEVVRMLVYPTLPLPGGDRIVQVRNWDTQTSQAELRVQREFMTWRASLRSLADLGAFRDRSLNLIAQPGDARPVQVAEITASGFRIASASPLLGRALIPDDERPGEPLVAVLGHEVWRTRFAGDAGVIGRSVQLGEQFATVVGVMPEGFEFPFAHDVWTPLRLDAGDQAPRTGPTLQVFGRLAPGASLDDAQAELNAIGRRMAAEFPQTHQHLQPQLAPYAKGFPGLPNADLLMKVGIPGFAVMLLVLVCGNVALLLFARAATRQSELVVRSALGASRRRIVAQLFAEALVLGGVAAVLGLAVADFGLRQWGTTFLEANMGRLPFWIDVRLSPLAVLYAIGLTVLGAAIAGVLPALKVTRGLGSRLREAGSGGGGLRFGGVWTAVIITQVAFTTAFPAMVLLEQMMFVRIKTFEAGFPSEQYLGVKVEPEAVDVSGDDSSAVAARRAVGARFVPALERLRQRVASEPGVLGVTFVDRLPRDLHREVAFELDDEGGVGAERAARPTSGAREPLRTAHTARVDASYFDVVRAPILSGRAFQAADFVPQPQAVIVDQGFVDQVLDGRNPIGRRLRWVDRWARARGEVETPQPWMEIVGVVKELGVGAPTERGRAAGVYLPTIPGEQGATHMMVHVRGDPMALVPQVRTHATMVDPTLRLAAFQRVDQVTNVLLWIIRLWLRMTVLLTAIALLLSLAGIYAVMSFTVSRRTREIGIRVAMGANARRVVTSIFRRPLTQVGIGVVTGALLAGLFLVRITTCQDGVCDDVQVVTPARVALLVLYAAIILGVCLLACIVPTRRALAVHPVDALRAE